MKGTQARPAPRCAHAAQTNIFADYSDNINGGFKLLDEVHSQPEWHGGADDRSCVVCHFELSMMVSYTTAGANCARSD